MITEILWFISWPVLIAVTYYLVRWAVDRFESTRKA